MQKFHKYNITASGRHITGPGKLHTQPSKSWVNSTNITEIRCEMCQSPQLLSILSVRTKLVGAYNHSERFFYIKDIDDLVANSRNHRSIQGKDVLQLQQTTETLSSYCEVAQFSERLAQACEYFRYFKDLPRNAIGGFDGIIRRHYEKHRIIEYQQLRKVLRSEEEYGEDHAVNDNETNNAQAINQKETKSKRPFSFVLKELGPCNSDRSYLQNGEKGIGVRKDKSISGSLASILFQLSIILANVPKSQKEIFDLRASGKQTPMNIAASDYCKRQVLEPKSKDLFPSQSTNPYEDNAHRKIGIYKRKKTHVTKQSSGSLEKPFVVTSKKTEPGPDSVKLQVGVRCDFKRHRTFQSECFGKLQVPLKDKFKLNIGHSEKKTLQKELKDTLRHSEDNLNALFSATRLLNTAIVYGQSIKSRVTESKQSNPLPVGLHRKTRTELKSSPLGGHRSGIVTPLRRKNSIEISGVPSPLKRRAEPTPPFASRKDTNRLKSGFTRLKRDRIL